MLHKREEIGWPNGVKRDTQEGHKPNKHNAADIISNKLIYNSNTQKVQHRQHN